MIRLSLLTIILNLLIVLSAYTQIDTARVTLTVDKTSHIDRSDHAYVKFSYIKSSKEIIVVKVTSETICEARFVMNIDDVMYMRYLIYKNGIYLELYSQCGGIFIIEKAFQCIKINSP